VTRDGRRRGQAGFSYMEVLIGIVILAIVAGAVMQGFAASSAQVGRARLDTVATDIAQSALEQVRRMDYENVGVTGGNPPGTLQASATRRVDGTDYLVQTSVTYADDPTPGRPRTYINYKRVTVTVTPQVPSGRPVVQSTLAAPPNYGAVSGKATAVITVVDALTDAPLPGAVVTIDGSTSPTRSDTTGADGRVTFAGLDPSNPDPASSTHRYRVTSVLPGYSTHPDSTPAQVRQSLTASQTWQATVKMYRPAGIRVNVRDRATGAAVTERSEVRVTTPPPASISETFVGYTGVFAIDRINGAEIQPSRTASTIAVSADCYTSATQSAPVPAGYPDETVQVFNVSLDRLADTGNMEVWIVDDATGRAITTAQVQVSGGEAALTPRIRGVDANGYARYCLPRSGAVRYVVSGGAAGYGAGSVLAEVRTGQSTPVTLRLVRAATGDIRLLASASGVLVRLQALQGTYDASQATNTFGYADFTGLAAGDYVAYYATGFSGDTPVWSSGVPVRVNGGQLTQYRLR